MFEDFQLENLDVGEVRVRVRYAGDGPAVLLVHGRPRTHATWYAVAPALVQAGFSVVCPDLRGYGDSSTPPDRPDHSQASKREMAVDLLALMTMLGHARFHAVGHDRGGYVVQRLALDHPGSVDRVVITGSVDEAERQKHARIAYAADVMHHYGRGPSYEPRPAPQPKLLRPRPPDKLIRRHGVDDHFG